MATTQKVNGGRNVVLKPLTTIGKPLTPRVRRTSEQVTKAKVQRELDQAEKAMKRANALAASVKRAQERAAKSQEKAAQLQAEADQREREAQEAAQRAQAEQAAIQSGAKGNGDVSVTKGSKTIPAVQMTPEIEKMIKNITKDFGQFFEHLEQKYGVMFDYAETDASGKAVPTLVKRGFISVRLRGNLPATKVEVEHASNTDLTRFREQARFMQFYKEVGLTQSWLNREVTIKDDPNTYIVSGLRGKAHSVVLRRKDDGQAYTMSAADLKASIV